MKASRIVLAASRQKSSVTGTRDDRTIKVVDWHDQFCQRFKND